MELSARDAVPVCDLVPAGVAEIVRAAGGEPVSSGDLITRFYSRWSDAQLAAHRRSAQVLREVANDAFAWLATHVGQGITESRMREHVIAQLVAHGAGAGADCIAATARNASNPHYEAENGGATFRAGDVVLLDLWAKETEQSAFADQTWMACLGGQVPARAAELFGIICRARDAAIAFLQKSWSAGRAIQGYEVDDVTRAVIRDAGYADYFIHRTGHSIDTATHGMGPNIDNLETHETRVLLPGVGFSIEPGIYIAGEIGVRTEINVYMSESGPEVTPGGIQSAMATFPDV